MSKIKLDLSQFKHKSSDKESTTLIHEKHGHSITLAHKALSPENREQLKALSKMDDSSKKASDRGEAKADKQKGSGTVYNSNTAKGIKQTDTLKKEGAGDYGTVVVVPSAEDKARDKEKGKEILKRETMAEGGEVQRFAEQGLVEEIANKAAPEPMMSVDPKLVQQAAPVKVEAPAIDPDTMRKREIYNVIAPANTPLGTEGESAHKANLSFGPNGEAPKDFDPNSWANAEKTFAEEKAANAAKAAEEQQKVIQANSARTAAGLAPLPVPNVPNGPQMPGSEMNQMPQMPNELPKAVVEQAAPPSGMPNLNDSEGLMQKGFQDKLAGINAQAAAQGKLGEQQAQLLDKNAQIQAAAQQSYKTQYDELEKERQAHMADIKSGFIDPNQYWKGDANGNGGHSKIAAGIGMILAGFNPTSNPNGAINFLKNQMEMNLQAQKENLGAKQNMLSANLRQFGNLKDATDMTRLMQADILKNELLTAAAKAQTPMAKAAALAAAGDVEMTYAPIQQNFAMRRAMMHLADNGHAGDPSDTAAAEQMIAYMRLTDPEKAKEMESRLIPGVGMAKKPVPEGVAKELIAKQNLNSAASDLYKYASQHTNLIPGTPEYNIGVQKAVNLQQLWREGVLNTVFREGEQPLMAKVIDENPAGLMKRFSALPKLKELIQSNERSNNVLKQGYGLPIKQPEPEIRIMNGAKYQQGPTGWHKIK